MDKYETINRYVTAITLEAMDRNLSLVEVTQRLEKRMIEEALLRTKASRAAACELLGVGDIFIKNRILQYDIDVRGIRRKTKRIRGSWTRSSNG